MAGSRVTRRQALGATLALPGIALSDDLPRTKPASTADLLLEILKLRHGKYLNASRLAASRATLKSMQATAERLRQVRVEDEPAMIFSVDRS